MNERSLYILTLTTNSKKDNSSLIYHLDGRDWLEFERTTIADIAVFPYVALAPDGKISLDNYPHVLAWIERIKSLPNFVPMAGIDN